MTNETGTVEVTQADRDAAQRIWHMCDDGPYCELPNWLIQAFARHRLAAQSQPAATVQEVGREAQQKTVAQAVANIVGAPYDDWRHFTNEADAILARLAALTAEPAAKAGDADSDLFALAQRYKDTMGLTREGAIRRVGVLVDAILGSTPATTTERGRG